MNSFWRRDCCNILCAKTQAIRAEEIMGGLKKIDTASGETFRFVVNGRAEWVDAMAKAKHLRF